MDVKTMNSEELADILTTITAIGTPVKFSTQFECKCLIEAAERLNRLHRLEVWMEEFNNER